MPTYVTEVRRHFKEAYAEVYLQTNYKAWEWVHHFQREMLLDPPLWNLPRWEVESDLPEGSVDGADTLSPASRVPLGWVGGVLQPLPSVVPIPTLRGLGAGDGVWSQSDEEVH